MIDSGRHGSSDLAADAFPTRPLRILVNTAPGGLTDVTTRVIAQQLAEQLKQSVVVENRGGGRWIDRYP